MSVKRSLSLHAAFFRQYMDPNRIVQHMDKDCLQPRREFGLSCATKIDEAPGSLSQRLLHIVGFASSADDPRIDVLACYNEEIRPVVQQQLTQSGPITPCAKQQILSALQFQWHSPLPRYPAATAKDSVGFLPQFPKKSQRAPHSGVKMRLLQLGERFSASFLGDPANAYVNIHSTPNGAEVWINGKKVSSKTPIDRMKVASEKSLTIDVEKKGYKKVSKKVELDSQETLTVLFQLTK